MPGVPDRQDLSRVPVCSAVQIAEGKGRASVVTAIVVAAAVIERNGELLVTCRQPGVHLAGYWEFPGGKCEPAETLAACLARELREELDVEVRVAEELFSTAMVRWSLTESSCSVRPRS